MLSSGSQTRIAAKVTVPMMAKANNGPGRPIPGSTNNGASAGPRIVPSPNDEASADKALTRDERRVRDAR